ncbi:sigma-70 family RNA polymerase sigma factor [Candidatus Peregrinibacteria bacterium CG10_big_fil_rev_8_21_14_0_10_49_16]|nr:MAG: RNA polymerase subunit sigma-24 [Candidatus Peregrinibacteria bacterium CG22_combo_CG10-13_8_21_14_all_49_11]PIR51855.1 MAG: sigma-70 family RNA polymerase sigma factor [Candidatus Peregrinibacteria bacterium CG10_big_fil_rev_8_21_14_0_10_49_16]
MREPLHESGLKTREEEFAQLYNAHHREVWACVYARWLNAEVASDITQESFVRLWQQRIQGEDIRNPRAWLLRVARNLAEDYGKSAFKRYGTKPPAAMKQIHSREDKPPDLLIREEQLAQVRHELERLSPADRELLTLRYAMEYTTEEIATLYGVKETAVHMRLSRARQRLTKLLQTGNGTFDAE